jgi:hypothetical protein
MNRNVSLPLPRRRGVVAILAVLALMVFLGCAALTIDIGYICLTSTELQSAADAAALAGVARLTAGDTAAISEAQTFAAKHKAGNLPVVVSAMDVELGVWNFQTRTLALGGTGRSAVRVTARRDSTNVQGPLDLFLGPIIGVNSRDLLASSTAATTPVSTADIVPMSLRHNWSFGPVDPKIVAANPGKDGPSYPTRPTHTSSTAYFNIGDQVTVAVFGQGSQSPVHLTLDLPNFGDESKVLRGELSPRSASIGNRYFVIGQGTGQGGLVGDIARRISDYSTTNPKRTVIMPIIKTLSNSRDSNGQLSGQVELVDFVAVHLDATPQVQVPKPDKPSETMTIMLVVGTIVDYVTAANGNRTTTSIPLPKPSVYSLQLVQ